MNTYFNMEKHYDTLQLLATIIADEKARRQYRHHIEISK